jgi:N-acetylneuraminate lyase
LVAGAQGAVGSTYNIAAPLYQRIIDAFAAGDIGRARRLQFQSVTMIRAIFQFPFHPAMKEVLKMLGTDCGRCRLPHPALSNDQLAQLRQNLEQIGFFDWARGAG